MMSTKKIKMSEVKASLWIKGKLAESVKNQDTKF